MGRVSRGSIIIEVHELDVNNILSFLKEIFKKGYREIEVTTYPGYFYGRTEHVKGIQQYVVTPLSFIISRDIGIKSVGKTYIVEHDTWIDTKILKLDNLFKLYNIISRYIKECSKCIEEKHVININNYLIEYRCINVQCNGILYMDGLNTQYAWIVPRRNYMDEIYKKALTDLCKRKPVEYVLSYFIVNNDIKPLLIYKPQSTGSKIIYNIPCKCEMIEKYMFWSLIDILLI